MLQPGARVGSTVDRTSLVNSDVPAPIAVLSESGELSFEPTAPGTGELVLEDEELLVAFDRTTGALTRMQRKTTQWTIERRPALAASFRLHAPMRGRRDNFVIGNKQRATGVEKIASNQVRIQWKNLGSEHAGVLPITLTAIVSLKRGTLTFDCALENDSSLWVETIDYPYFGDLSPQTPTTPIHTQHMMYDDLVSTEIHPSFTESGYWGIRFPRKTIESWQSQVCLIQTPQEGIYVGIHDPAIRYLLEFTFEQHPGTIDSVVSRAPDQDEISDIPVHLEFSTCHFVFARPHSIVELAPIVIRTYSGDWHAGIDLYKEWRATWFVAPKVPAWTKEIHSWLQLQINTPEEDYSIAYRELIEYGEECAQNGVTAIQLVGWNRGGQDRGDPSQDTDPGLGTRQELHDAIAQIQAKGVRVILFAKLVWADLTTEWYKQELYQYAATDPYGNAYMGNGYGYLTATQLAGINNRRRAAMDFCSQEYRDIATREFEKLLALGAAGWLFDEVWRHGPVTYSFSPDHGYTPPGYIYSGDIPLARQLHAAADKVDPDFLFAGEAPQDWQMQYYPLSYFRINAVTGNSKPAYRYLDPKAPLMAAATGIDDREMLNLILAYRCIISYEPYNFKGHVTDFPLTLAYGRKIDALRRKYREWIWDAEFHDTLGATVSSDGSHRYTVFRAATGKKAVVVVNMESSKAIAATLGIPNSGRLMTATPERPDAQPLSGTLQIPARSAIIVMEQ